MDVVELELYKLIREAVERYNRYRSPESTARIVSFDGERLVVRFEGSFCLTCGVNDWIEDLAYILRDLGLDAELVEVVEPEDPWGAAEWRVGVFRVKNPSKHGRRGPS